MQSPAYHLFQETTRTQNLKIDAENICKRIRSTSRRANLQLGASLSRNPKIGLAPVSLQGVIPKGPMWNMWDNMWKGATSSDSRKQHERLGTLPSLVSP